MALGSGEARGIIILVFSIISTSVYWVLTVGSAGGYVWFGQGTEGNDSYVSRDWIYVNVSTNYTQENSTTFFLYNGSMGLVNETTVNGTEITFAGLGEGAYYYNATHTDKVGLSGSTGTRKITVDVSEPDIEYGQGVEGNGSYVSRDWV